MTNHEAPGERAYPVDRRTIEDRLAAENSEAETVDADDVDTEDARRGRRGGRRRGAARFLRDVAIIIVAAIIISFLIKTFLIRSFYIPSASMEPTLYKNDRIIVNQLVPDVTPLERGDVIVFKDPGNWLDPTPAIQQPPIVGFFDWALSVVGLTAPDSNDHLVKRVIGLPGDHVVCCNEFGQMTINGVPLEENYLQLPAGITAVSNDPFDVVVPKNSLWVMGDNRYNSRDSRYNRDKPGNGFVPFDNVVGRAILVSWPADHWTWLDNHEFVFRGVDAGKANDTGTDQTDESSSPTPQTTTGGG
ncbi:MAG TPA: signal peptidase I [Pseudolysinimonas sp.]|nr:signal peptidase I [Pseudolysinimonas sp.]